MSCQTMTASSTGGVDQLQGSYLSYSENHNKMIILESIKNWIHNGIGISKVKSIPIPTVNFQFFSYLNIHTMQRRSLYCTYRQQPPTEW